MHTGKLTNGFEYWIPDEAMDNYELLEALVEIDKGQFQKVMEIIPMIFGQEQANRLKEHVRGENGIVSANKMFEAISEIMTGSKEGKNLLSSPK